MKTYDALIVLRPFVDADGGDNVQKIVERLFKGIEHKMLRFERLGRRRLAYEIKRAKDGFVVTCLVEMDPASVEGFRRAATLSDDVLRLTLVSLDAVALKTLTTPRPQREHEGRGERGERGDRDRGPRGESRGFGGPRPGGPSRRPPMAPHAPQAPQGDAR